MKKLVIYLANNWYWPLVVAFIFIALTWLDNAWSAFIPVCEETGSFSITVIVGDKPIKEIDGVAVVPFDSEYKVLLKNNNNRRAVAKVTIDGANISSFGNIVVPASGEIKLERFITQSLTDGKRFKFVSLDHPEVDDPTRKENGLIRVEFKLEKECSDCFIIIPQKLEPWPNGVLPDWFFQNNSIDVNSSNVTSSSAEPGATVGGSKSEQKFHKVELDLEDKLWIIWIKLKGLR